MSESEFKVTPWTVEGEVNYSVLAEKFGLKLIEQKERDLFVKAVGEVPFFVRRGIFFSHRDLDVVLRDFLNGRKFYLYTGRGPSGPMHIGHIIPFLFTKYLQDKFKAELYVQMTSDEKYVYHEEYSSDFIKQCTADNILDIVAIGFDERKTYVIDDMRDIGVLYPISVSVARRLNFSTVKAVFGFTDVTNIGLIYFPAIQAAPAFVGYFVSPENKNCLIPAAVDQDPYWRVTRDIAPKLGFPKPAQIHGKFLPGLKEAGKMSASRPETSIYLSDSGNVIKKKIWEAFTGGQPTVGEQRKKGGNPDRCNVYMYFYFLFEEDDGKVRELYADCRSGRVLCGDCKEKLAGRIIEFVEDHRRKKMKAADKVERYLFSEKVSIEKLKMDVYKLLR